VAKGRPDMNESKGSILAEFCDGGTPECEPILQDALQVLQRRDISVSVHKKAEKEGHYIVISVKDIGTIDRKDMTEFLSTLFSRELEKLASADGVTVTLRDGEKHFSLPDDMQECVDWFHIE